jgi:D-glycero-alpha-D-manno-heptose-7-phosphate kinase
MIISRTPLRISFFGGGTDYPHYYKRKKGAVLGSTINKYIYISINRLSDFFDHKIRVGYSKAECVKQIDQIEHPSVRECLRFKQMMSHLDIHVFSDLPARTGLGSSSSFTVGLLNALYALEGRCIPKYKLAREAIFIEQECIRERVGIQDQFHAAFGGFNVLECIEDHISIRPLAIPAKKRELLEQHLLLLYTGLSRYAHETLLEQFEKTECGANDASLERMAEQVFEAEEILSSESLSDGWIIALGALLDEAWNLKKTLSSRITTPDFDDAYRIAQTMGAYGGKLCGAGGGGFLALMAPPQCHEAIQRALPTFVAVPHRLDREGTTIIYSQYD